MASCSDPDFGIASCMSWGQAVLAEIASVTTSFFGSSFVFANVYFFSLSHATHICPSASLLHKPVLLSNATHGCAPPFSSLPWFLPQFWKPHIFTPSFQ